MSTYRETLKTRFAVLAAIVFVVLGVLLVRLWSMQVLSGDAFAAMAENNRVREVSTSAPRGRILDRNGVPLVTNRPTLAVTLAPTARNDDELLVRLSALLHVPVEEIEERLDSVREDPLKPRTIAIDVPMTTLSYLAEHEADFPDVEIEVQAVREYPHGTLAAHVLGYIGEISDEQLADPEFEGYRLGDQVGRAGAERQFETVLQGDRGYRRIEVDARGRPRAVLEEADPIPGRDILLTLDVEVQRVAEEALERALAEARNDEFPNARAGAAVAIDVETGEIIAMASAPTYDPSLFIGGISQADWDALNAEDSEYPMTNRAIMAGYPPASTFKVFTGIAGLELGLARPGSTYLCQGTWTGMGEQWPKRCWRRSGHGRMSFVDGIRESCDVVFYEIGHDLHRRDEEELQQYARRFGYGSKTGIDLPGEVAGRMPDADWKAEFNKNYPEYRQWLPGDTVNISIGQGDVLATPLQVAASYAGLANDGRVVRPHVLKEVVGSKGESVLAPEPEVAFDADVQSSTLDAIRRSLLEVTTSGTGYSAFRGFPVPVAGKTGTAEVAGKDDYAWFAAYAPASEPRYAVAVVLEQGGHGGAIAGPAAREILSALFGLPVEHVKARDESR